MLTQCAASLSIASLVRPNRNHAVRIEPSASSVTAQAIRRFVVVESFRLALPIIFNAHEAAAAIGGHDLLATGEMRGRVAATAAFEELIERRIPRIGKFRIGFADP